MHRVRLETKSEIAAVYLDRVRAFKKDETDRRRVFNRIGNLRLALIVATIACFVVGANWSGSSLVGLACFLAGTAGVVASIFWAVKHRSLEEVIDRTVRLRCVNQEACHRLRREWSEVPVPVAPPECVDLPESRDLDLFGDASLFQLLCASHSPQGRHTLAEWLTRPTATPEELVQRQAAVRELASQLDWRQRLSVISEGLANQPDKDPAWLFGRRWLVHRPGLLWMARILPFPIIGLLIAASLAAVHFVWPIAFLLLGAAIMRKHRNALRETIVTILDQERAILSYAEIFEHLHKLKPVDPEIAALHRRTDEAYEAFEALATIGSNAGAHGSLVHPVFQLLVLWDVHVARRIEAWQGRYTGRLSAWFEALGEIEALASLAGLSHDEPDWVFPEFVEEPRIGAVQLGHPLIAADGRVANDVTLGPPGGFLFVTGSNMAGKSTLLRSIGLNVVLAQAGAPVCAEHLRLPLLRLATSMRIQDSINEGVSFFMAELQRMREIVSAAVEADSNRPVLYLLDEILQGTNTVERRAIVTRIVRRLLESKAIGAVTSHDLALAEEEELRASAQLVHFRENFSHDKDGKPRMTFDYRLRDGLATTTNALKILEVIEMPV